MSRAPARIPPFMDALENFWRCYPDMRFGQLVMNLSRVEGGFADIWEWDCAAFLDGMERLSAAYPATEEQAE